MKRQRSRTLRGAALALSATVVLGGCDFSVYEMPLPGGADVDEDAYTVTIYFDDVMDLVPQSSVKVNDVTVGKVEDIALRGFTAKVEVKLNSDVKLPDNAVAKLRQTSLLGEKFVSLSGPVGAPATGRLEDGEEIPLSRSGRNPEVEEVLGALSLLLNGGGIAQLKTITQELNKAFKGNEESIKSLLGELDEFTGQLDDNKADIIRAIESLNRLSKSVKAQTSSIVAALDRLPRALDSLDKQRDDLIRMLEALNELSDVGTRVIRQSKANTVKSLESLAPILAQLARAGDTLPKALQVFATYPFVDAVVGTTPAEARNLHQGDYTNLSAKLDINLLQLIQQPPSPEPRGKTPKTPDLPPLPDPGDLPGLGGQNPLDNAPTPRGGDLQGEVRDRLRDPGQLSGPRTDRRRRDQPQDNDGGNVVPDTNLPGLSRAQPGFAGHVETTGADTERLGYDPDVAALLLQGVTAR